MQPCNPAVGGPAKSQLVHECDALGGEIGKMADRCYLQKRILNRSKVWACARVCASVQAWACVGKASGQAGAEQATDKPFAAELTHGSLGPCRASAVLWAG